MEETFSSKLRDQIARQIKNAEKEKDYRVLRFEAGDILVRDGKFIAQQGQSFAYSYIPLCAIRAGNISIIEYGKAVKYLGENDLFGVFETAYFLQFGEKEKMGMWNLVANSEVEVFAFTKKFWGKTLTELKDTLISEAKRNNVPKPLSRLPLLDEFAYRHKTKIISKAALLFHSHLLESNYDLMKHLAYIFGYQNTFVLEKPYSTVESIFRRIVEIGVHTHHVEIEENMPYDFSIQRHVKYLWEMVAHHVRQNHIKRIIILSDGGDLLLHVPWEKLEEIRVVGVEQTQRGIDRIKGMGRYVPAVVDVATSEAKKEYESSFIADAIFKKLIDRGLLSKKYRFGILGYGSMGRSLIQRFIKTKQNFCVYDKETLDILSKLRVHSLEQLIQESDIIIGTTGTDALRGLFVERLLGRKTLISASSSNIEFSYIFDLAKMYANRFEDVRVKINPKLEFIILNGGYPINFDRKKEWEESMDIQLTRTLLYAGVLQALGHKGGRGKSEGLKTEFQKEILSSWNKIKTK